MKKCSLETSDNMQPGKKSKKIGISFSIFFCRGLKSAPWKKQHFLTTFWPLDPWRWHFNFFIFKSKLIALFESKKTSTKNLMYLYFLGQDIHLIDFPEKPPKNADLFFSSENGWGSRVYFFQNFLLIHPR